jgi:hypothetical protein
VPRESFEPVPAFADEPAFAPASPPPFPLKLIGIAERETPDGPIRTAILSGPADVFLVSPADQVLGRYTVGAVGADAVELTDATTGAVVRLALPQ